MDRFNEEFLKIKKNFSNLHEINKLNKYFIKKKLKTNTVIFLLNNQIQFSDLNVYEKIALCKGLYDLDYKQFNPTNFFTSAQLMDFETLVIQEERTNVIEFENVGKYNDDNFICIAWKPSALVKAWKNRNIRYNFDSQRQAILSVDRWGNVVHKMNINKQSVEEIKQLIKDKKYFPPDMLAFNIVQLEGKEPLINYDETKKKLTIKTEPNFDSPNTTFVDIVDGAHRTLALVELFDEGVDIDEIFLGFPAQISIITVEQALEFIYRQAKSNKQNEDFLAQKIPDKYKKFIDRMNSSDNAETNVLFNNIAGSYEEMRIEKKMTCANIFRSALKTIEQRMGVNFDLRSELAFGSKYIVDMINIIVEFLKEEEYEDLYKQNFAIFFGFTIMAYYLRANKIPEDKALDMLLEATINLVNTDKKTIASLKLTSIKYPQKVNYDFFINLIEEANR